MKPAKDLLELVTELTKNFICRLTSIKLNSKLATVTLL